MEQVEDTTAEFAGRPLPGRRTVLLAVAEFATAGTLLVWLSGRELYLHSERALPWWVFVGAFLLSARFVFRVEVARETHTFNLAEIPLVLGLLFSTPLALIAGRLLGESAVLVIRERQTPVKIFYNLSIFALECTVAFTVYAFASDWPLTDPRLWVVLFAATFIADIVSVSSVTIAIYWHGGDTDLRSLFRSASITAVTNSNLAIVGAVVVQAAPLAVVPLIITCAMVLLALRSYNGLSRRLENLQYVYDFTKLMSGSLRPHEVTKAMLDQARALMRSGAAAIEFERLHSDTLPQLSSTHQTTLAVRYSEHLTPLMRQRLQVERSAVVIARTTDAPDARGFLTAIGVRDCLIAPIFDNGEVVGSILVADRLSDVSTFDNDDARLFESLAQHASVALENGRLIEQLHKVAAEREYEARHDVLTGLPNRAHYYAAVDAAIEESLRNGWQLAVMIIDLDGFKEVNDTRGHGAGDELLVQVAERLQVKIHHPSSVARFGGDEFAVLVPRLEHSEGALIIANTAIESIRSIAIGAEGASVDASVGIALLPAHGIDRTSLLQYADIALYAAKAAGRGRALLYNPPIDEPSSTIEQASQPG